MNRTLQFSRAAFAFGLTLAVGIATIAFPPQVYHSVRTGDEAWFIIWIACVLFALAGLAVEAIISERMGEQEGFFSVVVFVALGLTAYLMSWMFYGLWQEKVVYTSVRDIAPLAFCGLMAGLSGFGFIAVLAHWVRPYAKRVPVLLWRS